MASREPFKQSQNVLGSDPMARGPQIRVGVPPALKEHIEATADRLGYTSAAELVREAIVFRLALVALRENDQNVDRAEEVLRRLLEPPR